MTEATLHACTEVMFVGDFLEKNCLVEILMLLQHPDVIKAETDPSAQQILYNSVN